MPWERRAWALGMSRAQTRTDPVALASESRAEMPSQMSLWRTHRNVAYKVANGHFLPGADREDVEQECLIALWQAARTWDGKGRFHGYATMIVKRRMIDAMRRANTHNQRLLSESARTAALEDAEMAVVEMLADDRYCPVRLAEAREELARIQDAVKGLWPSEREAIAGLVNGTKQTKRAMNASYTARKKLREALAS